MEQTECSKTLAYKIQTLGNYPEESIQQNMYSFSCKIINRQHDSKKSVFCVTEIRS